MDPAYVSLLYFFVKRLFLFLDEWGFYIFMYYLYRKKHYRWLPLIAIYGICCIYTSYINVAKIENQIMDVEQPIFQPPFVEYALPYLQTLPIFLQGLLTRIVAWFEYIYKYFLEQH